MQGWIPLVPESASTFSWKVDALYFYLSGVTLFFALLISSVLIFFVIRYRRRTPYEIPRPIAGSHKLETIWTIIPFIIAMTMFGWGARVYFDQYQPPENAIEVYVVGKQWMWKLQHATGQREINELHVPVNRKIKLIMTTEDVIHDFFVPAFRTKADVIPGRYVTIWFEATKTGRYHLFCAEYCGMNHSGMTGSVIVMEPREFDDWLSGNTGSTTPAAAGQQLYQTLGCASCHGANAGVFGNSTQLESGQTVRVDEGYIRESILNPQAKIVQGFGPIMPTFQGQVSEDQLVQLIAYIKSLHAEGPTPVTAASPSPSARPGASPTRNLK